MTATPFAPAVAACSASSTVSRVDCAPQCAKTRSAPPTNSSTTRFRSGTESSTPSPVVPNARTPSQPPRSRNSAYGATASSSSAVPPSQSGVSAAAYTRAIAPTLSSGPMASLRIERDGPVLRVTIAKPERRNAFDAALIAELHQAFRDVGDARAVVLAGDGPSFSAGADVDWQRAAIDLSFEENVEDALRLYRMLERIDRCPAPVVARIQGHALGGGSGLTACADVAIAGEDAVFGFSEVKLGIIPAVISPFVLPRIGPGAARRLFLTGERIDAREAVRIGLVHEVTDDLDAAVDRVVGELLTSGPQAVREAKRLVHERPEGEEAAQIAARLRTSAEGQDGLRAFLERRGPTCIT